MTHRNFMINVDKCTGCNLCVVACKDEHVDSSYTPWTKPQPEEKHFWIKVGALERGEIPRVRVNFLPTMCQHCEDAPCIIACPEGAIKTRGDGLVWIDGDLCTGCGDCQPACPYDVIYKNDDLNIAQKCTGCAHRLDNGENPRCVDVCPHEAITFDQIEEASGPLETLHPEYGAKPRVFWQGLPKPWITGSLLNIKTDEVIIGASVEVTDLKDGRKSETKSDEFGEFWVTGLKLNNDYSIKISRAGYKDFTATIFLDGDKDIGVIDLPNS